MKEAFLTLGRGVGQVMFQNNALSGLLMLAGILLNSWQMALLAIAGNVVSTLTACLSGYSREDIRNGLYGFNGTLVGIAIGVFMPVSVASFSLLVAGACLSAWIARLFSLQRRVPGFTAPFILSDIVGCLQRDDAVFAVAFRKCSDSPVTLFFAGFLSEHRSGDVSGEYSIGRSALSAGYHG